MHQPRQKPKIPWRELLMLLAVYVAIVLAASFLFSRGG
jgi:hypothetical protein